MSRGRHYSSAEIDIIRTMYLQGRLVKDIAKVLGRSVHSINDKLYKLRENDVELRKERRLNRRTSVSAFCRHYKVNAGYMSAVIDDGPYSTEFKDWLFKRCADGGFISIVEMVLDEMLEQFYEEQK